MVTNLSEQQSIANQFVAELRDVQVQRDPLRFRRNMERLGEIFAYEISKQIDYFETSVETPLGEAITHLPSDKLILSTILRAGLPLHQGLLNYFDGAGNAFISAFRKHHRDGSFEIKLEYISCPNLDDKVLIIADPMLATGASMVLALPRIVGTRHPQNDSRSYGHSFGRWPQLR